MPSKPRFKPGDLVTLAYGRQGTYLQPDWDDPARARVRIGWDTKLIALADLRLRS